MQPWLTVCANNPVRDSPGAHAAILSYLDMLLPQLIQGIIQGSALTPYSSVGTKNASNEPDMQSQTN